MSDAQSEQHEAAGPVTEEVAGPEPADDTTFTVVEAEVLDDVPQTGAEMAEALAQARQERDAYLEQAQRGRAEYLNLKRRSEEQLARSLDHGAERLLTTLLSPLDNLAYMADAIDDNDASQLAKGVRLVYAEVHAVLQASGLEPIPGIGAPFDPQVHEALLSEESDIVLEEPVVIEVLRPGYRFKGRTLRPASVKVAR